MYTSLQLSFTASVLLVCTAALPMAAQDFNGLVEKASQDLERGACTEAQRGFSQAGKIATEAVGVIPPPEQIRVALLLGDADVCQGDFDGAVILVEKLQSSTYISIVRPQVQFLAAEAAKGKGQYPAAEKNYAEAVRLANESLPETDPRRVRYLAGWADLNRLRGQYDESETHIQQAFSLLDKTGSRDSIERAYVLLAAGDLAKDRDQWAEAHNRYGEALAIVKPYGPEHPVAARAWLGSGLVELAAGESAAAETFLKLAQNASRRLTTSTTNFDTQDALGLLNLRKRKLKDAEEELIAGRNNRSKYRGDQHPGTAASLDHLGLLYIAQQRWDEALAILTRAQAIRRKALGPEHPELAQTLYHLGRLYRMQRKFQDSAASLYEALNIEKAKLGPESFAIALIFTEQGNLLADQGKYSDAEPLYGKALAIEEKLMQLNAPDRLESLRGLALALHGEAKDAEAAPLLTQWMKSRGESLPILEPDRLPVALAIAEIEVHDGKYAAAEKDFTEILSANEKLGKQALKLPIVHKGLGDALLGEKKWKEAARNYEAALPNLGDQSDLSRVWENLAASYAAQTLWTDSIRCYQKALDLAQKSGASDDVLDRLTLVLTDVSWEAGRADQASSHLNEWMSEHARRADPLSPDEARVLEKSATYFRIAKQYDKAEPLLRLLLVASDKHGTQGINVNSLLIQLADVSAAQGKKADAVDLYQRLAARSRAVRQPADAERYLLRSKELLEKDGGPGVRLISILQDLGETYVAEAKLPDARAVFEESRTVLQQNGLIDDPRMAVSLNGLGEVLQRERNFDEAAKLYDQANDVLKKSSSPPPRVLASVLYNIGSLKMSNDKIAQATDYFAQCLKLSEGNYTEENPPPIEQFDQIAAAYSRQRRFDDAEKQYRDNLELRRKFFGENSTEAAWGLYSLADFYNNARRQYDQAAEAGERALHYFEGSSGEQSEEVALTLNLLASIYGAKHDMDYALAAMERSASIQQKLGRPPDEITPTLSALGESYRNRKDYAKALQVYQKMADLWQAESFAAPNYQRAVLYVAIEYAYLRDVQHSLQTYNRLQKALQQQHDSIQQTKMAESYAEALKDNGFEKDARKVLDQAGVSTRGPGRQ